VRKFFFSLITCHCVCTCVCLCHGMCMHTQQERNTTGEVPYASIKEFSERFEINAERLMLELASDNHNLWSKVDQKVDQVLDQVQESNLKLDKMCGMLENMGGEGGRVEWLGPQGTGVIANKEAKDFWLVYFQETPEVYIHVYIYLYMYIYIHIYVYMYIYMCTCKFLLLLLCTRTCDLVCFYVDTHTLVGPLNLLAIFDEMLWHCVFICFLPMWVGAVDCTGQMVLD